MNVLLVDDYHCFDLIMYSYKEVKLLISIMKTVIEMIVVSHYNFALVTLLHFLLMQYVLTYK